MRIVILSGTIFPALFPRSFRATELAKSLSKMGHEVVLYGNLGKYDYTEFQKKTGITVKSLGRSWFGNLNSDLPSAGEKKYTINKLINRILGKMLHPIIDFPYCEFYFQAKRVLRREKEADLLITIAVPYALHWAAAKNRQKKGTSQFKRWIADCGDPMMGNPMNNYYSLFLAPLEKYWCKHVDRIVVPVENAKSGYFPEFREKINVIPQGINFNEITLADYKPNDIPTFFYCGAVYIGKRDPSAFLEYLCGISQPFRFVVYSNSPLFSAYKERLGERLDIRPAIPRFELIKVMSSMDFLVNICNNSSVQTPSKLIDYGLSKRPILNVSSEISNDEIKAFESMLKGDYSQKVIVPNIEKYNSDVVAKQFLEL